MPNWLGVVATALVFPVLAGCGATQTTSAAGVRNVSFLEPGYSASNSNSGNSGNSGDSSKSDSGNSDSGDSNSNNSSDSKGGDGAALVVVVLASVATTGVVVGLGISSTVRKKRRAARRKAVEKFISENFEAFRADAARGQGETIDAIERIAECPKKEDFGPKFKSVYWSIFLNENDRGPDLAPRVADWLKVQSCDI